MDEFCRANGIDVVKIRNINDDDAVQARGREGRNARDLHARVDEPIGRVPGRELHVHELANPPVWDLHAN